MSKTIHDILFQTFMAGFDIGKLEENRRGYNILEAEKQIEAILEPLKSDMLNPKTNDNEKLRDSARHLADILDGIHAPNENTR